MKKVNHSVMKQARRQRALNRFTIKPVTGTELDKGYQARKTQELAALHRALGN